MVNYRTLFISDVHLGTRSAQAELLLDFLKNNDAETRPQSHNDVLQKLLRKVRKGTRLVFVPGNHDEAMRQYCGMQFGGVEITDQTTAAISSSTATNSTSSYATLSGWRS
jgi:UDP-2,3-diacylglucosamine pyrophosphatase LpxH